MPTYTRAFRLTFSQRRTAFFTGGKKQKEKLSFSSWTNRQDFRERVADNREQLAGAGGSFQYTVRLSCRSNYSRILGNVVSTFFESATLLEQLVTTAFCNLLLPPESPVAFIPFFGNQKRQLQALLIVQAGVAIGFVVVMQLALMQAAGAAHAFGYVIAGKL